MSTTIQVSEEFRDFIYEQKARDQSYEEWLRENLEVTIDV